MRTVSLSSGSRSLSLLVYLALLAGLLGAAWLEAPRAAADEPSTPTLSGLGVRLVDAPKSTADDPRARVYIIDHLKPGTVIERRVEVTNGTTSPAKVTLYPAAARIDKGQFVGEEGRTPNELTSWTSVTPQSLELAPQERALVKVTVKVPALAERSERYGVVWAEMVSPNQAEAGKVHHTSRAGIRLYVSVGPGGAPPSDMEIVSLTAIRDKNVPVVQATLKNTGQRALDLSGSLTLADGPGGMSAGPFPVPLGTSLGIGESESVLVPLVAELPNGPWRVEMKLRSGLLERKARATLTFPTEPGVAPAVPAERSGIPMWAMLAGAIAVGLLLLLLGYLVRRRRRAHSPAIS